MQFKIEDYLNGEMQESERKLFESELAHDADLRAEVDAMRPLVRDLARMRLKKQIEKAAENRTRRQRAKRVAFVLSIGFGFLGGFMWWKYYENRSKLEQIETPKVDFPKEKSSESPDLNNNLAPEKSENTPKILKEKTNREIASNGTSSTENRNYRGFGEAETLDDEAVKLADKYLAEFSPYPFTNMEGLNIHWKKGDFEAYYHVLEQLEKDNAGEIPSSILLKSACLLKLHRPSAAKMGLFQIRGKNTPESREAEWLLALAFLMEGNTDSVRVILEKMRDLKHGPAASRLLSEI